MNAENWKVIEDAISEIPYILWGVIISVFLYFLLKNFVLPLLNQRHEKKMKEQTFEHEKFWHLEKKKNEEKTPDEELKDLQAKLYDTEGKLYAEKKEKELLQQQLEFYKDFLNKLKNKL